MERRVGIFLFRYTVCEESIVFVFLEAQVAGYWSVVELCARKESSVSNFVERRGRVRGK